MSKNPTVEEVEEQKKLAERNMQAYQSQEAQQFKEQQKQQAPAAGAPAAEVTAGGEGGGAGAAGATAEGIIKVILKTQFVTMEITDPNILAEFNTPDKYAQNLPFKGLEFNINPNGARLVVKSEDKKEVLRDAMSGVKRTETQEIKYWSVERGPNAPMPQTVDQTTTPQ